MKNIVKKYSKKALIFDLDDTIVSAKNTRKETMLKTIRYFLKNDKITDEAIVNTRVADYEKSDFIFMEKFLSSQDTIPSNLQEISVQKYIEAGKENEELLIDKEQLKYLSFKYDLYIASNRPREFYDPICKEKLDPYFKGVVCHGEFENVQRKPEPDLILKVIEKYKIKDPIFYIGNAPMDIEAANRAGLKSISVLTTHSKEELKGSDIVCAINDLSINIINSEQQNIRYFL